MKILELSQDDDKGVWPEKIGKADWKAGKYLEKILSDGSFYTLCGNKSRLLLLTEGQNLISFCTLAERDEVPDTDLTPWIGFVYTFPPYRGKRRIGKLIERAYSIAREEGHSCLYVSTDQPGLYENFGFTFMRTMKDANGNETLVHKMDIKTPDYSGILGRTVKGKVDRPLGSAHPEHPDMIYPVNYGYVENLIAGDGEGQDVYILGEDKPLSSFTGKVIAVCHRLNDVEDKWIATSDGRLYDKEEIRSKISFQEQYFMSELYIGTPADHA